jgi:hypothetical protein
VWSKDKLVAGSKDCFDLATIPNHKYVFISKAGGGICPVGCVSAGGKQLQVSVNYLDNGSSANSFQHHFTGVGDLLLFFAALKAKKSKKRKKKQQVSGVFHGKLFV